MKYAEYPIEYLYGPYTVRKDTFGDTWYWKKHPDETAMGNGDRPYDCFMQIDAYEREQEQTGTNDPKAGLRASIEALRRWGQEETYERVNRAQVAAGAKEMDFHPYSIQDKMLKINSLLTELDQTDIVKVLHFISSVLSDIIRSSNIR